MCFLSDEPITSAFENRTVHPNVEVLFLTGKMGKIPCKLPVNLTRVSGADLAVKPAGFHRNYGQS